MANLRYNLPLILTNKAKKNYFDGDYDVRSAPRDEIPDVNCL